MIIEITIDLIFIYYNKERGNGMFFSSHLVHSLLSGICIPCFVVLENSRKKIKKWQQR